MPDDTVGSADIRVMLLFLLAISLFNGYSGYSQVPGSSSVRLMFYNTENYFDILNDSLKDDEEFLPEGLRRWNNTRYKAKTNSIYKTITAAGTWDPPAVVAFCEVENRKVLENLTEGTYLSKYNYAIIHEDSPDARGIDVCMIYRSDILRVAYHRYWIPPGTNVEEYHSRSILYSKIVIKSDTLHLIVNHWPSRRGGVLAGEDLRQRIAAMIGEKADSINEASPGGAKIIITGDFNCAPGDLEMVSLIRNTESGCHLVNLSATMTDKGEGTYRYNGIWEMIDQVLISEHLLISKNGFYTDQDMLKIFKPDFLLRDDPRYPGLSPFPTYYGFKYQGGFSDHLPLLLDLKYR